MNYEHFERILNNKIFSNSKIALLRKVANNPDRYVGLFRPTKPYAKLLQNLLQSNEIRFGDAFEALIEQYFKDSGWEVLEKRILDTVENEILNVDQLLRKNNEIIMIEQKIRDDHDSTKKRGQIDNFERKLNVLVSIYGDNIKYGFFYFIDPSIAKNQNYYTEELSKLEKAYGVEVRVSYGADIFQKFNMDNVWSEIILYLERWRQTIPELPEVNFDILPIESAQEIKNLPLNIFRQLFDDERIVKQILPVIFPNGKTLKLVLPHIAAAKGKISKYITERIESYLSAIND